MSVSQEKSANFLASYPYHIIQFIKAGRKPKQPDRDIVATKWMTGDATNKKTFTRYPPPPYNKNNSEILMNT